jgi:hypothetical protein
MSSAFPALVLGLPHPGPVAAQSPTGVVVLVVLILALAAKVTLQVTAQSPRRGALRLLDVVIAPLIVVLVIVVLERFRDLAYHAS